MRTTTAKPSATGIPADVAVPAYMLPPGGGGPWASTRVTVIPQEKSAKITGTSIILKPYCWSTSQSLLSWRSTFLKALQIALLEKA